MCGTPISVPKTLTSRELWPRARVEKAMLKRRTANAIGFLFCCGLMIYALYAQHVLELEPCPLCIFQRLGIILTGLFFLLAALHNPRNAGSVIYGLLIFVSAGATVAIAGRHVWLQNLPEDLIPACGAGLDYLLETVPLMDALKQVFTGSGECAEISWSFLGLSMPVWVLIVAVGLALYGLIANLKLNRDRRLVL